MYYENVVLIVCMLFAYCKQNDLVPLKIGVPISIFKVLSIL